MLKKLKTLMGLAQRDDATAADLAASVQDARDEVRAAHSAFTQAQDEYKAALLKLDDAELKRLEGVKADARSRIDRAEAILAALKERLAEAEAREAEAVRRQRYDTALAQAEEARRRLALYPQMAADLVALLETVARAEIAVQDANRDLPENAAEIPGVEHALRDIEGAPRRVVSDRTVKMWVREDSRKPEPVDEHKVRLGNTPGRGYAQFLGGPEPVVQRKVRVREIQPAEVRRSVYPLAQHLRLPAFRPGDFEVWRPLDFADPKAVLARAAERVASGDDASAGLAPLPVVEMEFVDAPPPKPAPKRSEERGAIPAVR